MKWEYWITLYIERFCTARGLRASSIHAYKKDLERFRAYVKFRLKDLEPDQIRPKDVLWYIEYLRTERRNGPSAVNKALTVLKCFYRAMVAMDHLEPRDNPTMDFPKIKGGPRKLPKVLSEEEVSRLMATPNTKTVIGIRDRAIVTLLYSTGIRALECVTLRDCDVDTTEKEIRVVGKGGHERVVPFTDSVAKILNQYRLVRGSLKRTEPFFRTRNGGGMCRGTVYERVRVNGRRARIQKRVYPHRLRHTFATHMVKTGEDLETIRELLGHRLITSTQIYVHVTAEDLRRAVERHPVERLIGSVADLLPNVKIPFQESRKVAFA